MKYIGAIIVLISLFQICNGQTSQNLPVDNQFVSIEGFRVSKIAFEKLMSGEEKQRKAELLSEAEIFDNISFTEQIDGAIADFTKAIELEPKFTFAYFSRGSAYSNKIIRRPDAKKDASGDIKNRELAIADFTKAIELNPQMSAAYFNRASNYLEKKDYKSAIADYTKVIESNPEGKAENSLLETAYIMRAIVYDENMQKDLAAKDRQTAKELATRRMKKLNQPVQK